MHRGALSKAIPKNVHILCEKPIIPTLEDIKTVAREAAGFNKVFMTAYVLRYTAFYAQVKELLDAGRIGRLIGIDHVENVGHIHMSHSFVRGNWLNKEESSPMILQKSCHDMDLLFWLAGASCESLSSYGALNYFKAENAPKDAPHRCLDGCPHMADCPYHVSNIYLTGYTGWPVNVITTDLSMEGRIKALETGPYGRCVFHCDNNVVDHQTVTMKFTNGVSAAFTMSAFTAKTHRNLVLFGTKGEIVGDMEDNHIKVKDFLSGNIDVIEIAKPVGGHAGGDPNLISDFVRAIREKGSSGKDAIRDILESHYMAFAAEESRLSGARTIALNEFKKN
jgi:predicted dehydrogenase